VLHLRISTRAEVSTLCYLDNQDMLPSLDLLSYTFAYYTCC